MKLFLDIKARRFVKSAASNVALQTLHLKRRDQVPLEIIFVSNNAVTTAPTGTTTTVGLKAKFSDANFLAFAAPGTNTLNLNTEPVEAAFLSNPASLPALLEVRWSAPGESLRTATLQVELQNSVILGTEGTPAAIPDLKATQAQAEAGTSNETWITPLRAWDAIRAWAAANFSWANLAEKPTSFPPSSHTHTASQISDFSNAVVAAAPPTTDASLLTSGTLADARLSAAVTASLAKADAAAPTSALSAETQARAAADSALSERIDLLAENFNTENLDSIAEAASTINFLGEELSLTQQLANSLNGTLIDISPRVPVLDSSVKLSGLPSNVSEFNGISIPQSGTVNGKPSFSKTLGQKTASIVWDSGDKFWALQIRQPGVEDPFFESGSVGPTDTTNPALATWTGITVAAVYLNQPSPQPLGTASPGASAKFALADHVHPKPTPADIGAQPTGNYVTREAVQGGGSSYFERSGNAASQNIGYGQSVHQLVLANDTRLADARQALAHSHPTTDINSASVYFEITGSHPALEGFYDVWDIPNGRFRWANDNANPDGAAWTALRWNDFTSRWELGTYTAFTTWTPLYFHASSAVIPPATGWVALPGITQPAPTLAWYSQTAAEEITALHAEDARLQKTINDLSGSSTAAIQTLSTQTTNSLALKADLVSGLVPATQLPPISYQTTRHDGDGTAFSFAPPGTLTTSDSASAILVTINGVTQEPGSDYTLNTATNRVVLTSALPLGDKIVITRPILLPSNSTLTAEQLGALTATSVIDGGSF